MRTIIEPQRELPITYETDVLVVGGGPAGFSAALASSRTGAETLLVERYGFLGGMMTGGLVLRFPRVSDGINGELIARLESMDALISEGEYVTIDPEITKWALDEMLTSEQVKILFHSYVVGVILREKTVDAVIIESKSGRQAIKAKVIVDATGDGDVAYFSNCPFEMGDNNGVTLPVTTGFIVQQVADSGRTGLHVGEEHRAVGSQDDQEMRINGLNVGELSQAEILLRKKVFSFLAKVRENYPEHRSAFISQIGSQVGVRETRRIVGICTLRLSDWEDKKKFPDTIGLTFWNDRVPYKSLVPGAVDNLLVAGRCVSYARDILHRMRIIPTCISTGQGSGTAAALASKEDTSPRNLNIALLQRQLKKQNVKLEG